MTIQQTLQENWSEIKAKLRSKWGELTNDDLTTCNGKVDQLVDMIQQKTGETRESIVQFIEQLTSDGDSAIGRAGEAVRDYAHQAAEAVQKTSQRAAASVREGYGEAEDMVRQRPAESLAVCFVAGVITGVFVTLFVRWR